jgi:hypothetical protein
MRCWIAAISSPTALSSTCFATVKMSTIDRKKTMVRILGNLSGMSRNMNNDYGTILGDIFFTKDKWTANVICEDL